MGQRFEQDQRGYSLDATGPETFRVTMVVIQHHPDYPESTYGFHARYGHGVLLSDGKVFATVAEARAVWEQEAAEYKAREDAWMDQFMADLAVSQGWPDAPVG